MKSTVKLVLLTSAMTVFTAPAIASQDDVDVHALLSQIEALNARVTALEAQNTFTSFMPDFAERFHVMHRAGEAGDWAVAAHELSEMKRMAGISQSIDAEKGRLLQQMLGPQLDELGEAIEHADHEEFEQLLPQTINTCNACHTATGSDFIKVTLDSKEALSMRHPHQFLERRMPAGHEHGHSAGGGHDASMSSGKMPMKPTGHKKDHDDTGKPAHTD